MDADEWEQGIIDNASSYSVVSFTPQMGSRTMPEISTFDEAYSYAKEVLEVDERVRSCMIYAANEYKNHAMVGSLHRQSGWKPVERNK